MKKVLLDLLGLFVLMIIISSNIYGAGSFNFNDGTTQGWTLDQMYITSSQVKFTPVIGYSLLNSNNELTAYTGSLLIGKSDQNDIYLESPDLSSNSEWQGITGYSVDVKRSLYSPCWGDFANLFYFQLQIKVIDTQDGNKEKLYAEYSGSNFVFHDITTTNQLYHFTWQPSWLTDTRYKVKSIRLRITEPGDVMAECWYRGSWSIDNVTATTGSPTYNTNVGTNVQVSLGNGVNMTFDNVTGAGNTSLSTSSSGTTPPNGFTVVPSGSPVYYSITTTATYSGNINMSIQYNDAGMTSQQESLLKLMVYETTLSQWKDITTSLDQNANIIYGTVTHLSEFAVMYTSGTTSDTWTLTNQPTNGTITCFTVSGSNIFAGTEAGGVLLSTDNGTTWNPKNSGLTKYTVRALCANGTNIFAGTWGDGIFLSTNNGSNWTAVNGGLSDKSVASLYSDGNTILAGTWGGGVFISTNNGSNWSAMNYGITETHIRSLYISGSDFYAGSINGLFLSTNNGSSWTGINQGLTNTGAISLEGIKSNGNENLFTGSDGGGVFISTNNGGLWSERNTGLKNLHIPFLTTSGTNLFAATWGGGVFATTDYGASWIEANDGFTNKYIRSLIVNGTYIYAGADDGGIYRRSLAGIIPQNPSNHFTFTANTGDSYSIVIDTVTWNGSPLNNGDEVGVFTPAGLCVGASVWDGNTPLALTAWGDDTQTTTVDGYVNGEQMSFKIWRLNNNTEYSATATYTQGNGNFGDGFLAHISELTTSSTITNTLALAKGWSWISFNVEPSDMSASSVFAGLTNLAIVVNNSGQFYVPGVINNIGNLSKLEGYKVYLNSSGQLSVTGQAVSANTPIPLTSGWNFISYLPASSIAVETALSSILSNLAIIKNDDGNFYIPSVVNTLNTMSPGEGYKLYLNSIDTLSYTNSQPKIKIINRTPSIINNSPQHFIPCAKTGENYSIVVQPASLNDLQLKFGGEIGIFTKSGLCVGAGVLGSANICGIAAWADDERTAKIDGYKNGEEIFFKYWNKETNKEIPLQANFMKGNGKFGDGVFSSVELNVNSIPVSFSLEQNYPNPFNSQTVIRFQLPEKEIVELKIFDIQGREIRTLINNEMEIGTHKIYWDGLDGNGNLTPSGIYFYRLKTKSFTSVKKAVMLK